MPTNINIHQRTNAPCVAYIPKRDGDRKNQEDCTRVKSQGSERNASKAINSSPHCSLSTQSPSFCFLFLFLFLFFVLFLFFLQHRRNCSWWTLTQTQQLTMKTIMVTRKSIAITARATVSIVPGMGGQYTNSSQQNGQTQKWPQQNKSADSKMVGTSNLSSRKTG